MIPYDSSFVEIKENNQVYINFYNRCASGRRPNEHPEIKEIAQAVARKTQITLMLVSCIFTGDEWECIFTFAITPENNFHMSYSIKTFLLTHPMFDVNVVSTIISSRIIKKISLLSS